MYTKDMITRLLGCRPEDALVDEWLADRIGEVEKVKRDMAMLQRARKAVEVEFAARLASLDDKIGEVRSRCSHSLAHRHVDPSGSSGSWTECEICGKELP